MPEQQTFAFAAEGVAAVAPQSLAARLKDATRPDMVQVSPGKWSPRIGCQVPEMTLAQWHREADGTYTPAPITERMVKLSNKLCTMLGFPGQVETIRRLARAGNIECIKFSPQIYLLNIDSWFNHLRRCAEDAEFWDRDGKNYRNYVLANGGNLHGTTRCAAGVKEKGCGRRSEVKSKKRRNGA